MRSLITGAVIVILILTGAGLFISAIHRVCEQAERVQCQSNLKQIGMAIYGYHDTYKRFPTGTVLGPALAPEKRLNWCTMIRPYVESGPLALLDSNRPWDDSHNCPPRGKYFDCTDLSNDAEGPIGQLVYFICPANPVQENPTLPSPTHYLGIAGVGEAAATLQLNDRNAGIFGYDRKVKKADLKDGESTTMMVAEATDGGPWTAGGPSTVRGLVPARPPYLGEDGQFSSRHQPSTNVLFADGSVRAFTPATSPQLLEALATIAGGEEVPPFDE